MVFNTFTSLFLYDILPFFFLHRQNFYQNVCKSGANGQKTGQIAIFRDTSIYNIYVPSNSVTDKRGQGFFYFEKTVIGHINLVISNFGYSHIASNMHFKCPMSIPSTSPNSDSPSLEPSLMHIPVPCTPSFTCSSSALMPYSTYLITSYGLFLHCFRDTL